MWIMPEEVDVYKDEVANSKAKVDEMSASADVHA
jgi:hypothetical protein